jgi:hypothetical protein
MPTLGNTPRPAYVYDTETDTWVPVGVGAHTHSDIPNTLVDAKGDLITATADNVPARIAKGADGTVLVADSTTSTGLAWQPYAAQNTAGRNKIINGDFGIWQRGTSFTHSGAAYTADRFQGYSDGTQTYSRQAFTPGTAPASAHEGKYFWRGTKSSGSGTFISLIQYIEDVQTFAGQTMTVSFWAKADSNQTAWIRPAQTFAGGSATNVFSPVAVNITTSWTRVSATFAVPSIVGKTIGAVGSTLYIENYIIASAVTWDVWGFQAELGPVATPFTTATGTIQGELAACQRYYYRSIGNTTAGGHGAFCATQSTTSAYCYMPLPVTMRVSPTSIDYSGVRLVNYGVAAYGISSLSLSAGESSQNCAVFTADGASGMTANRPVFIYAVSSTNYIGFNAEL